ncbi:hypothetical protein [Natronorubrum sp. FCH18a]|uniref:hypothetical protein n=1 Tax=Natronorubrum sp. FCH18a TaxID=3447018 RepID=UPI003F51181B
MPATADAGAVADYALLTVVGVFLFAAALGRLATRAPEQDYDHDHERGQSDG